MKKGFTLIELIFTIVILAITTMAIPRMVAQTANLNSFAINQELVFNAKTMMSRVQHAKWDSAYIPIDCKDRDNLNSCDYPPPILNVTGVNGDTLVDTGSGKSTRPGIKIGSRTDTGAEINTDYRRADHTATPTLKARFGSSNSLNIANIGNNNNANALSYGFAGFNDIDDYDGFRQELRNTDLINKQQTGDFVLTTTTDILVDYEFDPAVPGTNYASDENIKAIFRNTTTHTNPKIADAGTPRVTPPTVSNVKLVTVASKESGGGDAAMVTLDYYTFNVGVENQAIEVR